MAHSPLNLVTALSLVLSIATAMLWVRSYFVGEWLGKRYLAQRADCIAATDWRIWTGRGSVEVSVRWFRWGTLADWPTEARGEWRWVRDGSPADVAAAGPLPSPLNRIGFGVRWDATSDGMFDRAVAVPLWLVCLLLGVNPAVRLYRRVRRRNGICPSCGYDIRATADRCPECGTPATTST